ncbi:hypothetical protein GCM10010211_14490 [Streptomyces albospinus]|uniref:Transposase n=1 Tax=Streptomyces albospinus TaxID=285515 RepID=A0ABQ2US38_9ACTN|nr:hypothetical protein [Streptomyces albospinus]GGU50991.1 hypothetical protein GCM10010211_14490 [Streptomyces albospinus]
MPGRRAGSGPGARRGIAGTVAQPARHSAVREGIERRAVEAAKTRLNRVEQVKRFSLLS